MFMKRTLFHIVLFLLIILSCLTTEAQVQVKASIDRSNILIGEPIQLTVEAYVPMGQQVQWVSVDSLEHFEVINRSKTDTTESIEAKKFSQVFTITSFDSGKWEIPQLAVIVDRTAYYTDTFSVSVAYADFNPEEEYRDIKDIIFVQDPYAKYIPWIVGVIAIVATVIVVYILTRKKKVVAVPKASVSAASPFDEAMRRLHALRGKQLSNGMIKEYYTELNDILRVFVFRKLLIATMEKTNQELILELRMMRLPSETFTQLSDALRISDFVKFAKYQPDASDNERNFEVIRSAIQSLNDIKR
jgi:hypothetical protein